MVWDEAVPRQTTWVKILVPVGAALAVTVTVRAGIPDQLPAVALDSEILFHALRAALLLWGWVLFLVVLLRGLQGELPVEFSTTGGPLP
jgi:hypothetical protein